MTTQNQTELLDNEILLVLSANNTRYGLEVLPIIVFLRPAGLRPLTNHVLERMEYLTDKGLVCEVAKTIGKSNRAWKITDAGRDYLDQHNL